MENKKVWITFNLENEEMKERFESFIESYERGLEIEWLDDSKVAILEDSNTNKEYDSDSIYQLYNVMKDSKLSKALCELQSELDELEE